MDAITHAKYVRFGDSHPVIRPFEEFEEDSEKGLVRRLVDFFGSQDDIEFISVEA